MAIELKLDKSDDRPWGFRLVGGADFDQPLTVVKVSEGSLAELAGLKVDDVVVKVNDILTRDLTHLQVHDVIQSSGGTLLLTVDRDDLPHRTLDAAEEDQIKATLKTPEETDLNAADDIATEEAKRKTQQQLFSESVDLTSNILEPETDMKIQERKWSTFLQKPKGEKPKPRKSDVVEIIGEPYRVIIKKQKKKGTEAPPEDLTKDKEEDEDDDEHKNIEEPEAEAKQDVISIEEEVHKETPELETESFADDIVDDVKEKDEEESVSKSENAIAVEMADNTTTKSTSTIEDQLALVQRQLQELSQLPSAIQSTLDVVTKQLEQILSAAHQEQLQQHQQEAATENDVTDEISSETLEEKLKQSDEEELINDDDLIEGEKMEEDATAKYGQEETPEMEANKDSVAVDTQEESELDPDEGLTEEELAMKKTEYEKFEKLQKDLNDRRRSEQRHAFPLTPLERPIILPGGRKWSQPDDACPTTRHPKMTDEKIADTIETYSEVIAGHLKGLTTGTIFGPGPMRTSAFTVSKWLQIEKINFLKYQPPPKNLDYLQRSEVYRLVHDMEPPVKGISRRACKILAEQDYYPEIQG